MMLEAAPQLTPDEIKRVLQETATPMLGYSRYEVGAGYLNTYAAVLKVALGKPFGGFRSLLNQTVSYSRDALSRFGAEIAPGSSYSTTFNVPDDALSSTIQVVWVNHSVLASSLSMAVTRGGQVFTSKPAALLAGQWVQKTGVTLNDPAPGEWTITVTNTSSVVSAPQNFAGAVEVTRASYGDLSDIGQLSASDQQAIKRALRAGLVTEQSSGGFGVNVPATRLDLARAVMLGAGALVPQFLPASPSFLDVPAGDNAVFVESVVNSPYGNLLGATGLYFNPQSAADRITAAKGVVRALGLEALAQASGSSNPGIADWNLVPQSARGYVAVAVTRNLMNTGATGAFRPFDSITRAELARTASALQQTAR
jgi:serine protease AprX